MLVGRLGSKSILPMERKELGSASLIRRWAVLVFLVWHFQRTCRGEPTINFTLAFLTSVSNKGSGQHTGGAFFLALDHLNAKQTDDNRSVYFNHVFRDTKNIDITTVHAMVDIHCSDHNVSVYIGPPGICSHAALLATSFSVPYFAYDCIDMQQLMRSMADYLIINEHPLAMYVSKFIIAVLKGFGWRFFSLVTGEEDVASVWQDATNILIDLALKNDLTIININRETLNDVYRISRENPYSNIIQRSLKKTRVFVFLGDYNALVDFVRALHHETGSTRGEYVVVAVDDMKTQRNNKTSFLRHDESARNLSPRDVDVFRNVLVVQTQQPTAELKGFVRDVYDRNHHKPINLPRPPFASSPKLQPEAFYIYDAVMHYGEAVRELIQTDQDPRNGELVVSTLRNSYRKIKPFCWFSKTTIAAASSVFVVLLINL